MYNLCEMENMEQLLILKECQLYTDPESSSAAWTGGGINISAIKVSNAQLSDSTHNSLTKSGTKAPICEPIQSNS